LNFLKNDGKLETKYADLNLDPMDLDLFEKSQILTSLLIKIENGNNNEE